MKLAIYQVDAFADSIFTGNPAAVCPLESWIDDEIMQAIAEENNLAETAFFVTTNDGYHIRWFTPTTEVALCGHATLASAYILFEFLGYTNNAINFQSQSGLLIVTRKNDLLTLDFPAQPATKCIPPEALLAAFTTKPVECLKAADYILVFESELDVQNAQANLEQLKKVDLRGVIITAPSSNYDFVCRFFGPNVGINEDPVTGSAYTQLTPYWSKKLTRQILTAKQLSARSGKVWLEQKLDRVLISGKVVLYMQGEINI